MIITIPQRFCDPFIFCGVAFEACEFKWDRTTFKTKIKSHELLELYEREKLLLGNQLLCRVASHFDVKFILQKDGSIFE